VIKKIISCSSFDTNEEKKGCLKQFSSAISDWDLPVCFFTTIVECTRTAEVVQCPESLAEEICESKVKTKCYKIFQILTLYLKWFVTSLTFGNMYKI